MATLNRGALTPPLGDEVWRDDWLLVPGEPGRLYRNLFTGRESVSTAQAGRSVLKLAEVFGEFPVAALLSD